VTRQIRQLSPGTEVIIFTMHDTMGLDRLDAETEGGCDSLVGWRRRVPF
jgi:hypothetical protein